MKKVLVYWVMEIGVLNLGFWCKLMIFEEIEIFNGFFLVFKRVWKLINLLFYIFDLILIDIDEDKGILLEMMVVGFDNLIGFVGLFVNILLRRVFNFVVDILVVWFFGWIDEGFKMVEVWLSVLVVAVDFLFVVFIGRLVDGIFCCIEFFILFIGVECLIIVRVNLL